MSITACMQRSEENAWESMLFHHAGPRDQTWVVGLGDTCLASLSHLRTTKVDNLKRSLVNGREYGQEESEQSLLELQATERRQD